MKLEVTEISTTKILIFFTPLIFVLILGTFGETFPSHLWKDTAFDIVKKVTYGASFSLSNISWLYMGLFVWTYAMCLTEKAPESRV